MGHTAHTHKKHTGHTHTQKHGGQTHTRRSLLCDLRRGLCRGNSMCDHIAHDLASARSVVSIAALSSLCTSLV